MSRVIFTPEAGSALMCMFTASFPFLKSYSMFYLLSVIFFFKIRTHLFIFLELLMLVFSNSLDKP